MSWVGLQLKARPQTHAHAHACVSFALPACSVAAWAMDETKLEEAKLEEEDSKTNTPRDLIWRAFLEALLLFPEPLT